MKVTMNDGKNSNRIWKEHATGLSTCESIEVLEFQRFGAYTGEFAVKSDTSGRILTVLDRQNERMSIPEIEGTWTVMVPDTLKEEKLRCVREMIKRMNSTGMTYGKIYTMSMDDIWEWFTREVQDFDTKYTIVKSSIETKLVK